MAQSIVLCGMLIGLAPWLSQLIFGNSANVGLLQLVFLTVLVQVVEVVALAKFRLHEQAGLYATLALLRFGVGAFLNIYFIVVLQRGVEGLITATLWTAATFALVYVILLRRELTLRFSTTMLRRMLQYGMPLVPATWSAMVMTSADRYFLNHYWTTTEVGLYSLGYSVGLIVNIAVQAVQLAWPAHMFGIVRGPNAEAVLARTLTYYVVIMGFVGLGVSVLAEELLLALTTPEFSSGHVVVPFIALSYVLYGVRFMTNTGMEKHNKTRYGVPIMLAAAGLNVLLNYLLIPDHGMIGAAVATVVSYSVLLLLHIPVNLQFWYVPYEYKRLGKVGAVTAAIFFSSLYVAFGSLWMNVTFKIVLLSTYPILLHGIGFFNGKELSVLRDNLRAWRLR